MNWKERLEKIHSIYENLPDDEITVEFRNAAKELIDMVDESVKLISKQNHIDQSLVITNSNGEHINVERQDISCIVKAPDGTQNMTINCDFSNRCIICGSKCEIDTMVCRECKDVIKRAKESYHRNGIGY